MRILRLLSALTLLGLLAGCNMVLMSPAGDIALQQRNVLLTSTALMLLIIVPVLAVTVFFAWRYRAPAKAKYAPDWEHSLPLEVLIWAVPLLIIIAIGAITWMGTHLLDPYRPLDRIKKNQEITAESLNNNDSHRPLVIQVVALDWKWLFLYPEQGIASLNEVVAPVDRPIQFRITSSSVMNSFYIPALAGQIYAMPGMQTKLHAVINEPGDYEGFSANFSGPGFNGMRFRFRGVDDAGFTSWVGNAANGGPLGRDEYLQLEKPSEYEKARQFRDVPPDLFSAILNRCVDRNRMCMHEMMAIDDSGGGGLEGLKTVFALPAEERQSRASRQYVAAICTTNDIYGEAALTASATN